MTHLAGGFATSRRVARVVDQAATANESMAHDAELVRRFIGGDDAAFAEIVARYRGKMFAVGLSLLRNRADAEDIAQETFIRAHGGLARFRGDSSLATWLHSIACNLSRNRYWYLHRRGHHEIRSLDCALGDRSDATLADVVASAAPNPLRETVNQEFIDHVTVCMENLSPNQREILRLRNLMNCSYVEIARRLGISVGTVKSRIARARTSLRRLLAGTYAGGGTETWWFEPISSFNHMVGADG